MRGRKPKPSHLKAVAGNPGKRPLNKNEPQPEKGVPVCPSWLSPKAKIVFREIGGMLDELGVMTRADRRALELLCDAYATYREASEFVRKHGFTYESKTITGVDEAGNQIVSTINRRYPEVDIASDAWKRIKSMLIEFGMTPSSRSRISVNKEPSADDKAEQYFG